MGKERGGIEKKIGKGVKNKLEARENSTNPTPKEKKLSFLNRPSTGKPSNSREAVSTPLNVKSMFRSMLTNRLSKIISGSAIRNTESRKATKLKPLHKYRTLFAMELTPRAGANMNKPRTKPKNQPTSVSPS